MRSLSCPRCSVPMSPHTVLAGPNAVLIDTCATSCAGIWLDSGDLETGLDVTDDLQQLVLTREYLPDCRQPAGCPICSQQMHRYRWNYTSPVTLDQCPDGHGIWIDGGEVQEMEAFEEHEVLPSERQVQLRAKLGMDRLQLAADHQRPIAKSRNPTFNLVELLCSRFF
jgi:Zn-finger nucleic acid-binding protein